jgi:malate dehydrogenase (oxaloacetate-decarboxylating)(NADP+)
MQKAMTVLKEMKLDFEVEGEMHADAAIDEEIRKRILPSAKLEGAANLLIMPTLDAANIAFNFAKRAADGLHIGPILLGVAQPAHVLTPSATARTVLNMTAIASVEAQTRDQ